MIGSSEPPQRAACAPSRFLRGEHTVALKDWSGLFGLNLLNRTARFPADQIVHIVVDKGTGGAAYWTQISATQARDIAREIEGANKK